MLSPLEDRIVVRPHDAEQVSRGGVIIPDAAQEKPQKGEVVAVGPGKIDNGVRVEPVVQVGDVVLYSRYGGTEIKEDDEELLVLRESDVLGILRA